MAAERSLQTKKTKKAREDVRIATSKIESLTERLSAMRATTHTPQDDQIFPMTYWESSTKSGGRQRVVPLREAADTSAKCRLRLLVQDLRPDLQLQVRAL